MQNLNCSQVLALLTFYIEGNLNPKLMSGVEYHLNICSDCRKKYMTFIKILKNYEEISNTIAAQSTEISEENSENYKNAQYRLFKENLSAYIDNELSDSENIKIRKIAIINPAARKDLEDIISFRALLKSAFLFTKNSFKEDFSEYTVNKVYSCSVNSKENILFSLCYVSIIVVLILTILGGLLVYKITI